MCDPEVATANSSWELRSSSKGKPTVMRFLQKPLGAVLVIILVVAAYYMWWHTVVLERISIAQLKIVEHTRSGLTIVHVSGWCLDDAYAIKRITATVEGSSINLLVYAFLVRSGKTGAIEYDVTIPPSVNELRFGKERVVIWRRGGSGTTP